MSEVYSADDLIGGSGVFSSLKPPARLGVFGDPVAHSKSPAFHNAALRAAGIDASYVRVHVPAEKARAAFRALPKAGFLGANVTIPHKSAALAAVDEADDYARKSASVNTVVVQGDRLLGFNTDGPGLVRAIREEFSVDLRDLRIVLLGAGGGAGRAIAAQCAMESCERLVLVNRTLEKAQALASELASAFRTDRLVGPVDRIQAIPFEEPALRLQLAHADLVINATSVGMRRTDPPLIPPSLLTPNLMVYDTVYASGQSRLLEDAAAAGARCANGLGMLLHQGALAFEIWFNRPAPLEAMRQALASLP
ncbi:MAG: shikimate dehydrogenase [Terrimicrobiaceae bacterium]|nr:shikimate dehydrogenase [Terrimicrobiaceae bacterium]